MRELLADAWTVMQKEMHELVATRSSSPSGMIIIISVVLFLGIIMPLQAGAGWLEQPWLLSLWAWLPVLLVATIVADSVAGERERHTLETLLASRLPDRAILLGKVGAAVVYGWGLMLITILVSIVAINLVSARDQLLLYRPVLLIGGGLLSLLTSTLAALFGVLVSLRAQSVRRAQQIITTTLMTVFVAHVVGLPLLLRVLPERWQHSMADLTAAFDRVEVVGALALLLLCVNVVLLALAGVWFQRNRLHLD